jgi:hypothetical protein
MDTGWITVWIDGSWQMQVCARADSVVHNGDTVTFNNFRVGYRKTITGYWKYAINVLGEVPRGNLVLNSQVVEAGQSTNAYAEYWASAGDKSVNVGSTSSGSIEINLGMRGGYNNTQTKWANGVWVNYAASSSVPSGVIIKDMSTTPTSFIRTVTCSNWGNNPTGMSYNIESFLRVYGTTTNIATPHIYNKTSATFTTAGLNTNTHYEVSGNVNNGVGWAAGTWENKANMVTGPAAPVVNISDISATTAKVNWSVDNGGGKYPITKYYKIDNGSWVDIGTSTTGTVTLDGLTSNTTYTVTLRANTTSGVCETNKSFKTLIATGAVCMINGVRHGVMINGIKQGLFINGIRQG